MSKYWLGDQIQALLHIPENNIQQCQKQLVSSPGGKSLYSTRSFCGRFWCFIWSIVSFFECSTRKREAAFFHALERIQHSWNGHLETIREQHRRLAMHWEGCFDGSVIVSSREFKSIQNRMCAWGTQIRSVLEGGKSSLARKILHIDKLFRTLLVQGLSFTMEETVEHIQNAVRDHALLQLGKRIKGNIPYFTLKKTALRQAFTTDDTRAWHGWIERLVNNARARKQRLTGHDLHLALEALSTHMGRQGGELGILRWNLHKALVARRCSILAASDSIHQNWVDEVRLGVWREVNCNGTTVRLGNALRDTQALVGGGHLYFENLSNPDSVVGISAKNASALAFERNKMIEAQFDSWLPKVLDHDPRGIIICEKLTPTSPDQYNWSQDIDGPRRIRRLDALIKVVKEMKGDRGTPEGILPEHWLFDRNDSLKLVHACEPAGFDLDRTVDFITDSLGVQEAATQHQVILRTGITTHVIFQHYCKALEAAARSNQNDLNKAYRDILTSTLPNKEVVHRRAQGHCDQLNRLIRDVITSIRRRYHIETNDGMGANVGSRILDRYKSTGTLRFATMYYDELGSEVVAFRKPNMRQEPFVGATERVVRAALDRWRRVDANLNLQDFRWDFIRFCNEAGIVNEDQMREVARIVFDRLRPHLPQDMSPLGAGNPFSSFLSLTRLSAPSIGWRAS